MQVKIKLESPLAQVPSYQTNGSSGMDVSSVEEYTLQPGERKAISTGLSFEIPAGLEIQVRPRSGLALKSGITVLNTPGTIDSDYRGILKIILVNLSTEPFHIGVGHRIAQIVFAPVVQVSLINSDKLNETERGAGGFGSTGIK